MEKLLSVSVAAYNVEKFINQCLNSFVYPNMIDAVEVLIVVDGATDHTLEIARKYESEYPLIFKVIDKQNGGWGSTVNAALSAATGKYFRLLDGDDYYLNANLQEYIYFLQHCSADVVQTPYIEFEDVTNLVRKTVSSSAAPNIAYQLPDVQDKIIPAMHACAFRTELLRKNGIHITEKCFYTDIEYTLKSLDISQTVLFWENPIYMYRVGRENQSVSLAGLKKHGKEHLQVLNGLLEYEQTQLSESHRLFYQERLKEMVCIQYSISLSLEPTAENLNSLKEFDLRIKNDFPHYDLYRSKKLTLIRKLNYHGMYLICRLAQLTKKAGGKT